MDIQKMIADAQAQADANGDNKLTGDDLDALAEKHGIDPKLVDSMKARADANGDGKLDVTDLKSDAASISNMANDLKGKFFGS